MRTQQATPNADQEAAFRHTDVVLIGKAIAERPHSGVLRVLRQAMISAGRLEDDELRDLAGGDASADVISTCRQVADAAHRIMSDPDAVLVGRLKGAVLERLVHDLVAKRAPRAEREVRIELLPSARCGRAWSHPKELVVPDDPFEAFECKFSPNSIDQDDVDGLCDIDEAAEHDGRAPWSTLVVLASDKALVQARVRLRLHRPLKFAHLGDIVKLRREPARRQIV